MNVASVTELQDFIDSFDVEDKKLETKTRREDCKDGIYVVDTELDDAYN